MFDFESERMQYHFYVMALMDCTRQAETFGGFPDLANIADTISIIHPGKFQRHGPRSLQAKRPAPQYMGMIVSRMLCHQDRGVASG